MKNLLLLPFLLFFCISIFAQSNYYVSTSGNDGNDGSLATPWLTIQFAADQLSAGDILNIRSGTYNEKVEINVSGSVGNFITIQNYLNEAAIIDGTGTTTSRDALLAIFDQNYIIIKGLLLTNNQAIDAQGILVEGTSHHIELRDNEISEINFSSNINAPVNSGTNSQAIIVYGTNGVNAITNLIIDGNNIHDCRLGFSEGLAVNGNVDGFEVTNNTVHDITNIGIDIIGHEGTAPANDEARNGLIKNNTLYNCLSAYATSGGIYVDGGKNLIIENNTSYQNGYGIEVGCENNGTTTSGIMVRNNLFYNNEVAGLAMGGFDYPNSGKVTTSTFKNNTLFQNDYSGSGNGEMYLSYCESCVIEQNIFHTNSANKAMSFEPISMGASFALNYNLFYTPGAAALEVDWGGTFYPNFPAYQTGASQDANSGFSNPQFANANLPSPDLHINTGSPAIDTGNPAFTAAIDEKDMDGDNRIINSLVDIGADENTSPLAVHYSQPLNARLDGKKVKLSWITESEENSDYFLVERSEDGVKWFEIGEIQAKGQAAHYTVYDRNLLEGQSYYRLKQFDLDATFSYSNIVEIYVNTSKVEVYPNPASRSIWIKEKNGMPIRFVEIFNQNGQLCQTHTAPNSVLDISALEAGVYFIKINVGGRVFVERLVVE